MKKNYVKPTSDIVFVNGESALCDDDMLGNSDGTLQVPLVDGYAPDPDVDADSKGFGLWEDED